MSSGEAEFYGVVKASGIALGDKSLVQDSGYEIPVRVWTDSSAAMGISQRQGLGKLRLIDTQALWIQSKVRDGSVELRKVRGEVNPADLFTKHLTSQERIGSLVKLFSCDYRGGRAASAPQLRAQGSAAPTALIAPVEAPSGEVPDGDLREAALHDPELLLHHYSDDDIDAMFPRAEGIDEAENLPDAVVAASGRYQGPLTVSPF